MKHTAPASLPLRPSSLALVLAFTLVYLSWGTTYLAIKEGVKNQELPPALFGGVRVCLAGVLLLAYLAWRGERLRLPRRDWFRISMGGIFLFIAGNGLMTAAEKTVPSGVAAVLAATTPLWMGLLEMAGPGSERLSWRGWVGLLLGLAGVCVLLAPKLDKPEDFVQDAGLVLAFGSACSWAMGTLWLRHRPSTAPHLSAAAYQMMLGGGGLTVVGLFLGEVGDLTPAHLTVGALVAFCYLLVVGSLVGFVAYNWLLRHVPATQAGTCAYVNPVVAILVGWFWGNEDLTGWIVGGMGIILVGVALVRMGGRYQSSSAASSSTGSEDPGTIEPEPAAPGGNRRGTSAIDDPCCMGVPGSGPS